VSKIRTCDGAEVVISLDDNTMYISGLNSKKDPIKYWRNAAEEIVRAANRHLRDENHFKSVSWTFVNSRDVCSHCGYDWEVDDEGYPCCCQKAIEEFEASKEVQS